MVASRVTFESPRDYFSRGDVVSEYSSFDFILPPEREILEELGPSLASARMLDVGVGAGRTTLHFAPRVREYLGIDVSSLMIDACRRRFSDAPWNLAFETSDACDLESLDSDSFDFVLFSFNGLDTVGDREARSAALRGIHRVCRPDARFCFSSSNLHFARLRWSIGATLSRFVRSSPYKALRHPRRLREVLAESRRWRRLNPDRRALAREGEGLILEERRRSEFVDEFYASPEERIQTRKYYIDPGRQADQLGAMGFEDIRVWAPDGTRIHAHEDEPLVPHWWLYYLCTKG